MAALIFGRLKLSPTPNKSNFSDDKAIFKNENFTIDDLKIILQYAIMSKDKDSEKFRLAINDLTLRENKNNFSKS